MRSEETLWRRTRRGSVESSTVSWCQGDLLSRPIGECLDLASVLAEPRVASTPILTGLT